MKGAGYHVGMSEHDELDLTVSVLRDEGDTLLLAVFDPSGLRVGDQIVGLDSAELTTSATVRSLIVEADDQGGTTTMVELDRSLGEPAADAGCFVVRRAK